ncbi:hypothetical protein OB920_04415 [Halobacteria archaeon HArc-gm2]|nr:hypothetical protein [Halobacteria archaeon HArc-gm2]
MKRRTYLGAIGGVASAGVFTTLIRDDLTHEPELTEPDSPFQTIETGTRDGIANPGQNTPHRIAIWNASSEGHQIQVEIRSVTNESRSVVLDETYEFPANSVLEVRLLTPDEYLIEMRRTDNEAQKSITVARDWFDCNSSRHKVTIPEDGHITVTESSTLLACDESTTVK